MMKFEKISFEQYAADFRKFCGIWSDEFIKGIYEEIKLPTRGTAGSAGYDFFAPFDFSLLPADSIVISTGIRFVTDLSSVFLMIVPRSGLGFKYGARILNTAAIIDGDYAQSDNEGHILIKMACEKPLELKQGKGFCQGIILPYYKTDDDVVISARNGGFGSTGR